MQLDKAMGSIKRQPVMVGQDFVFLSGVTVRKYWCDRVFKHNVVTASLGKAVQPLVNGVPGCLDGRVQCHHVFDGWASVATVNQHLDVQVISEAEQLRGRFLNETVQFWIILFGRHDIGMVLAKAHWVVEDDVTDAPRLDVLDCLPKVLVTRRRKVISSGEKFVDLWLLAQTVVNLFTAAAAF